MTKIRIGIASNDANSKTKKNVNIETFCREAKMTVCVCLSQYVCAWWKEVIPWLWKSRLINTSSKFSTPARPYSGSATRRNNSSAFPIGDQSHGCCRAVWALPARAWCEALSYILGSGGATNDVLTDFTKLIIFMTKLIQGKALYALHRDGRKLQCFI